VELDHFFTSLIRKDAAGGLTLLTNPSQDAGGGGGVASSGRLSPPVGPSPAYSLPPSPFREVLQTKLSLSLLLFLRHLPELLFTFFSAQICTMSEFICSPPQSRETIPVIGSKI
jgi:hypothetical protein